MQYVVSVSLKLIWAFSVAAVAGVSLTPSPELPVSFWSADKVGHFLGYFWLALLPFFAFHTTRVMFSAALAMFLMGVLLEGAQSLIPGRHASGWDMVANGAGVILGIAAGRVSIRIQGGRRAPERKRSRA